MKDYTNIDFEKNIAIVENIKPLIDNTQPPTEDNINYNIYNALNLVCEDLGSIYLETGFNPFYEDFEFNENYVINSLNNKKEKPEIQSPDFIEMGEKAALQAFINFEQNLENLMHFLQEKLNDPTIKTELKNKIKIIISQLLMQLQLLIKYKKQLNNKNILNMYINIMGINWKLSSMLLDGYYDELDPKKIFEQILQLNINNQILMDNNKQIIHQAKQIILDNQAKINSQKIFNKQNIKANKTNTNIEFEK